MWGLTVSIRDRGNPISIHSVLVWCRSGPTPTRLAQERLLIELVSCILAVVPDRLVSLLERNQV